MWIFHDFSITQILKLEIIFGDYELLHFMKAKNDQKLKTGVSKIAKNDILEFLGYPKIDFT